MREPPAAFWCRIPSRPNFGDALTPWLITRITGQYPTFRRPDDPRPKYFVTGSVLDLAGPACSVWGAGIMNRDDTVSPDATLWAVRGPRSRARALASGTDCPDVYGDPASLLPRFYAPAARRPRGVGLAAHFSDRARLIGSADLPPWIRLIDMQNPIESVIDDLCSCELVVSSSLHGLIVSHAYGIAATWVELAPLPSGDRTKFHDYLDSIGRPEATALTVSRHDLDLDALRSAAIEPPSGRDLDAFWDTCPFRSAR